jgi:prepilin-type N-terminal cleavage/methylation domain-containing protein
MSLNFKAFTLPEVLITIGIIGIISAITIPTIITNYQKRQTVNRLKSTYSTLGNAIRLSEADNDGVKTWDFSGKTPDEFVDTYLIPYLKCSKKIVPSNSLVYKQTSGNRETGFWILRSSAGTTVLTLLNGVQLLYAKNTSSGTKLKDGMGFFVDINGYDTLPNKFGRDTFYLAIYPKTGLVFHRIIDTEDTNTTRTRNQLLVDDGAHHYQCNKQGRGSWCGELIRLDGWQIAKDYPW